MRIKSRRVIINLNKLGKNADEPDLSNIKHEDVCGSKPYVDLTECCNAHIEIRTGGL